MNKHFRYQLLPDLMKLQKHVTRKHGNKKFYKYVVVLPTKTIKELGWNESQELVCNVTAKSLLLIGLASKNDD